MFFIVSIGIISIVVLALIEGNKATLVSTQNGSKKLGDFILHIRVEEVDKGIKVYRALQYKGKESVVIEHRTPLISVSLDQKNRSFTSSTTLKEMNYGHSYHPQKAKIIEITEEGQYTLYCAARFKVGGKDKKIKYIQRLTLE
ncbi:hypothetical protein CFK37_03650 [Virgibacillus phasianinus]|uniref:Uncharacterized protein n=1 Tax=Virgibacillus phasianinus TaxID=2017483 RepID=A0A220U0E1_9BACI|nr:hypothetical protein [Virgibacillus phasianinus]ASK61331.1 hypothetical protein CFK37_03650 [Virgibacillus phasianinus]